MPKDKQMNFKVEIETTWEDFVSQNPPTTNNQFVFRGQLNGYNYKGEFERWPLMSSFNREYKRILSFGRFISQRVENNNFKRIYGKYNWVKEKRIVEMGLVERLLFLQHYGVSTCFLDFTYNPLIALYFALAPMKVPDIGSHELNGYRNDFGNAYLSIYKINCDILVNDICIKEINTSQENFNFEYDSYWNFCYAVAGANIGLLHKKDILNNFENRNLNAQNGCFILYDNINSSGFIGLEKYLEELAIEKEVCITEPCITIYNITWDSILARSRSKSNETIKDEGLFTYLKNNNISGETLFTDHQGLKYDLDFFYEER